MLEKKYAPKYLEDVIGQQEVINPILHQLKTDNTINNLIFVGSAGVGKSTTAFCIKNHLFGDRRQGVWYELNGSENNGVDTVREKILEWCRRATPLVNGKKVHKIIFIDEFDYMTSNAQAILRKAMEEYSNTTRFILTANYKNKIIPALLSRCQVYDFKPLSTSMIKNQLIKIAKTENIYISEDVINTITSNANGDMRHAIKLLDGYRNGIEIKPITKLLSMTEEDLYTLSFNSDIKNLFSQLYEEVISMRNEYHIHNLILLLAEYDYKASMASHPILQFQSCVIKLKIAIKKMKHK